MRLQTNKEMKAEDQSTLSNGVVQRAAINEAPVTDVPPIVHEVLQSPGQPLDAETRAFLEPRFGHDFSEVRVHTDAKAAESAQVVNALAYTVGQDIVFQAGQYAPQTNHGRDLMAHELTHVTQQDGIKNNSCPESVVLYRQVPFPSSGSGVSDDIDKKSEPIIRTEQAKHAYGLECLCTSIMYMIQSYGLIPPDMSRQEFESAFTPLTPPAKGSPKTGWIKVGGKEQSGALPIDLFSKALEGSHTPPKVPTSLQGGPVTKTEATLRGADWGGFSAQEVLKKLPNILRAFHAQSLEPGYEFMRAHRSPIEAFKPDAKDEWATTNALANNTIGDEYFQKGNTLMAELCLRYPAISNVGHRCVIVGKAKYSLKDPAGNDYYLYPADDPWYGQTLVMAPSDTSGWFRGEAGVSVISSQDGSLKYKNQTVFQLASGDHHVYRRKT